MLWRAFVFVCVYRLRLVDEDTGIQIPFSYFTQAICVCVKRVDRVNEFEGCQLIAPFYKHGLGNSSP